MTREQTRLRIRTDEPTRVQNSSSNMSGAAEAVSHHAVSVGCPFHNLRTMLRGVGLRPTRQRMSLGWLLFAKGDRHVTAELLFDEAMRARVPVSLATVYNTLHQFTEAGLLRQLPVDGPKSYFDTNPSEHHHFFIEGDEMLMDLPGEVDVARLPEPPEGMEIARVDVVVRLRRKTTV
jgi:Fur family transcriptional regulator, iron response regulator